MTSVEDVWAVQIIYDGKPRPFRDVIAAQAALPAALAEAEENITDLLPAGWSARITRWDQPPTFAEDDFGKEDA